MRTEAPPIEGIAARASKAARGAERSVLSILISFSVIGFYTYSFLWFFCVFLLPLILLFKSPLVLLFSFWKYQMRLHWKWRSQGDCVFMSFLFKLLFSFYPMWFQVPKRYHRSPKRFFLLGLPGSTRFFWSSDPLWSRLPDFLLPVLLMFNGYVSCVDVFVFLKWKHIILITLYST